MVVVTSEFLERGRSKAGGWSRDQLRCLGVAWPPPKGWQTQIAGQLITDRNARRFLSHASALPDGDD
jgi:hypothetical protein